MNQAGNPVVIVCKTSGDFNADSFRSTLPSYLSSGRFVAERKRLRADFLHTGN